MTVAIALTASHWINSSPLTVADDATMESFQAVQRHMYPWEQNHPVAN